MLTANKLALNLDKTNIIKFTTNSSPQYASSIGYNGKYFQESVNTKFFGLQIDNHLIWTNHTDKLIPKLSGACYAVTCQQHTQISIFCLFSLHNKVWSRSSGCMV
jgi:hypothetical protein